MTVSDNIYAPLPPRPKKTNVTRTRTGCHTCRGGRRKCDESKPECERCRRRGLQCGGYALRFSFLDTSSQTRKQAEESEAKKWKKLRQQDNSGINSPPGASITPVKHCVQPVDLRLVSESALLSHDSGADEELTESSGETLTVNISSPEGDSVDHSTIWPSIHHSLKDFWADSQVALSTTKPRVNTTDPSHIISPPQSDEDIFAPSPISPYEIAVPIALSCFPSSLEGLDQRSLIASVGVTMPFSSSPVASSRISSPSMNILLEQTLERRYLTHFNKHVSVILPPAFLEIWSEIGACFALKTAVLAVSASNLARLQGSKREIFTTKVKRKISSPHFDHLKEAFKYYNLAIRKLSRPSTKGATSVISRLTATILFAYFELECGSMRGFFTHVSGADALVLSNYQSMSLNHTGRLLLSCWAALRGRQEAHKLPFRPLDCEQGKDSAAFKTIDVRHMVESFATGKDLIFILLCESNRLNRRILLSHCMSSGVEDSSAVLSRSVSYYSQLFDYQFFSEAEIREDRTFIEEHDLMRLLVGQKSKLDSWHDSLDFDELPTERFTSKAIESFSLFPTQIATSETLLINQLHFRSHHAAKNYMYYAIAQLLCSLERPKGIASIVYKNYSPNINRQPTDYVNPWAYLILRIITSLDFSKCSLQDTYTIGTPWVLFTLCTCVPDIRITRHILRQVIPRIEREVTHERFNFRLTYYMRLILVVHREIEAGREVLLLHPNHLADEELINVVDYDRAMWAAIHGRIKGGGLFNDFVKIP